MEPLYHESTNSKCLLVALANKEVRLYNEKYLVSTFKTNVGFLENRFLTSQDLVTAMKFGPFGRETGALILVLANGALSCKLLSRTSSLTPPTNKAPPEQDVPLKLPKKTRLYQEQVQREKESAGGQ